MQDPEEGAQKAPGIRGRWDEEIRYVIEERAAILEFDAGLSREDAEAKAFAMMLQTDEQNKNYQNLSDA